MRIRRASGSVVDWRTDSRPRRISARAPAGGSGVGTSWRRGAALDACCRRHASRVTPTSEQRPEHEHAVRDFARGALDRELREDPEARVDALLEVRGVRRRRVEARTAPWRRDPAMARIAASSAARSDDRSAEACGGSRRRGRSRREDRLPEEARALRVRGGRRRRAPVGAPGPDVVQEPGGPRRGRGSPFP